MTTTDTLPAPTRTHTHDAPRSAPPAARGRSRTALLAAVIGFFLITLDATIVNVALPSMQAGLGGGASSLAWIVDGYTLPFAALLLGAGALTDRLGAKRVFALGVAGFAVASGLCAAATDAWLLVGARVVQGAFAAVVTPASMALVRHAFPDATQRARAVSWWAMGGAVAAAAGPVLGGVLSGIDWRLVFVVNVPVALTCLVLLRRVEPSPRHRHPFDVTGQVLGMVAITGVAAAAVETGARGLFDPVVLCCLVVGLLAGAAFCGVQRRVAHPLVPQELFGERIVAVCVATGFTFMAAFFGAPFAMSVVLQQVRGLGPLDTGLVFLPMAVAGAVLTPVVPRIVEHTGPRAVIVTGQALLVLGLVALALVPVTAPRWVLVVAMLPVGFTAPLINPPTTAVLLEAVPAQLAGTAGGVYNTARQVGGALAVAVLGTLMASAPTPRRGLAIGMALLAAAVTTTALAMSLRAAKSA